MKKVVVYIQQFEIFSLKQHNLSLFLNGSDI